MSVRENLTPEQRQVDALLVDTHVSMLTALGAMDLDRNRIRGHIEVGEAIMNDNLGSPNVVSLEEAVEFSRQTFVCAIANLHRLTTTLKESCDQLQAENGGYVPGSETHPEA
jgi:hypothetical protein